MIQLNKFSVPRTKILLESFYRTIGKVSFLLIVDENDFSESEVIDLEKLANDIEIPISALFIKRITDSEYTNINKIQNKPNNRQMLNVLPIGSIEELKITELTTRCAGLLNYKNKFIERKKRLDENIISEHKCPLIINLYILEENFTLHNYVKRFLELIPNTTDGNLLIETLVYISLCDYYANCGFSA